MTRTTLLAGLLLALAPAAGMAATYQVSVNTAALAGQTGFLDFQFDPGPLNSAPATATVTGFAFNGLLSGTGFNAGGAAGQLPGTLNFDNGTVINDVTQAVTFGSALSFNVALAGAALAPPAGTTSGSVFSFSLFDSTASTALLTTDPNGTVADITVGPTGAVTTQTFPPTRLGGPPVALITSVPEPSPLALLALGLLPAGIIVRRRRA